MWRETTWYEKGGLRKLVSIAPWFRAGIYAGFALIHAHFDMAEETDTVPLNPARAAHVDIFMPDNETERVDHEMLQNLFPCAPYSLRICFNSGFPVKFAYFPGQFIDLRGDQVFVKHAETLRFDKVEFHGGF